MLTTSLILPHPVLSDFVYNYSLCKSESANINMTSPWFAHHDTSLCFFLGDRPIHITNSNTKNEIESTNKVCLFGLMTHYKGAMTFEGNYNTFIIEFKPTGADIYKYRWRIELFFKKLKQNFPLHYFLGDNQSR